MAALDARDRGAKRSLSSREADDSQAQADEEEYESVDEDEDEIDRLVAETIGEGLAKRSDWASKLDELHPPLVQPKTPMPRMRLRQRQQLSWRERRRQELQRARSASKVKVHPCERLVMFLIVFGILLIMSATLRLHSPEMMNALADWAQAQSSGAEASHDELEVEPEQDFCTDETCEV
eukprot:gb/GFBE01042693.1/.p1 GENE.gb/GFBE01042693.1/~~gb/GFBE01042693.1/.p1  ORF type:complete len:179 (+),score=46.60 gb/GFBE01042693.1/:1-537(+)